MLQELGVVVGRVVGAVVASTTFFAGQGRARYQQTRSQNVASLKGAACPRMRDSRLEAPQCFERLAKTRTVADNPVFIPHHVANLADRFLNTGIHRPVG